MRSIAEEAGMTAPALYWHYTDKEALLRDVRREVAALYRDHVYAGLAEPGALTRLKAVLEAYRSFSVDEPQYHDLLFLSATSSTAPRHVDGMFQLLIDRVRDCMHQNELREGDPVSVALTISAHAQGLVVLYRRGRFDSEQRFKEFYELSIARLFIGIARE